MVNGSVTEFVFKWKQVGSAIIINSAYGVSIGLLLGQLQLPIISDMIKQESAGMVYKALNAEELPYLTEQFNRVSAITSRTLRSSNLRLRPLRWPKLLYLQRIIILEFPT